MMQPITNFAAACQSGGILSFPTWYKYLKATADTGGGCSVHLSSLNDVWLIAAAIIEILLRVAGLLAVCFIVYAGIQYVTSQADPEKVTRARMTIINALVGLVIAILASVIINFIAGSIQ